MIAKLQHTVCFLCGNTVCFSVRPLSGCFFPVWDVFLSAKSMLNLLYWECSTTEEWSWDTGVRSLFFLLQLWPKQSKLLYYLYLYTCKTGNHFLACAGGPQLESRLQPFNIYLWMCQPSTCKRRLGFLGMFQCRFSQGNCPWENVLK